VAMPDADRMRRLERSRRRRRWALATCALGALLMWAACITSYFVEWSTFTKGPERPRTLRPGATTMPGMTVERDETHYMFGHGLIAIHKMNVYTGTTFNRPGADTNSRALAWVTLDQNFDGMMRLRPDWILGIRLWFLATAFSAPATILLIMRRRHVPPGHCRKCRYDLQGLSGDRCPECGAASNMQTPDATAAEGAR
jgi:hypothetical protein